MLKAFILAGFFAASLTSCDVRTKDKIADGRTSATDSSKGTMVANGTPTTVQIIDSVFDFGKVAEGETVEFSFRFKNTGAEPLIISNAAASCGCTVPEKPEAPIKPGETGFIKVKFNSEGRPGMAHKTVSVTSNASPVFPELLLKGEVIAKNKQ
ncbi:MAG: DUF1573 domain-containing protein [Sphingobacteriales bacterium]|nr:MAG: DUF1573 domain-containing protein [Sphingobacteriales bacterium]